MNNKTGKVIWFTFKQVVTSNWFCLISVLGLVCVFLSTQIDKIIGAIYGTTANISGQGSVTLSEHDATIKKNLLFFREIRSQLIGQKTKKDHKIYNSKYKINKVINHI